MSLEISPRLQGILEGLAAEAGGSTVAYMLHYSNAHGSTEEGNYLDIDGENISFLPRGKDVPFGQDPYTAKGRQSGRAARIARRFIDPVFVESLLDDTDFERFTNLIKAEQSRINAVFTLVEGNDIKKWYHANSYAPRSGTLNNSCMRYEGSQKALDFYAHNPEVCKLLILTDRDRNLLFGRALIWIDENGHIIMDRIYGSDAHQVAFIAYAKDQGWLVKATEHPVGVTSFDAPNGENVQKIVRVKLQNSNFKMYPYLDNLKWLDVENGILSNALHRSSKYELSTTNGNPNPVRY